MEPPVDVPRNRGPAGDLLGLAESGGVNLEYPRARPLADPCLNPHSASRSKSCCRCLFEEIAGTARQIARKQKRDRNLLSNRTVVIAGGHVANVNLSVELGLLRICF